MNKEVTVGIAIMSYKYGVFVAQAIDSILSQSVKPDQIIVVDDAGQDNTCAIAEKYGLQFIKRNKRLGPRANFQDVIMNVFWADYCMFLGADNWLHPLCIEKSLNKMLEENMSIVSVDLCFVGEYADYVASTQPTKIINDYAVWGWPSKMENCVPWSHNGSALFNREHCVQSGGQYPVHDRIAHDTDQWINMYNAGYKGIHIHEPLIYYRQHRFNFSQHRYGKYGLDNEEFTNLIK